MRKKTSKTDRTTEQVVTAWLNAQCGMPPQRCPQCGSTMTDNFVTFFLPEGEKSWTMPVPVCANCRPVLGEFVAAA
jgi:hypothetical protein